MLKNNPSYAVYVGVKETSMIDPVIKNIKERVPLYGMECPDVPSFSALVNGALTACEQDIMIFCSHRVRPTLYDIERIIKLISAGYGYVGLYRFACFGIHKKVIERIGYFDEGFIWGGYEDDDFRLRLNLANIAFYEDHSVEYHAGPSLAPEQITAKKHFSNKYQIDIKNKLIRFDESLGPMRGDVDCDVSEFLPSTHSIYVPNIATCYSELRLHYYTMMDGFKIMRNTI